MAVKHTFVSATPDGPDGSFVRPSNWNADHTIDPATVTLAMLANMNTQRTIGRNTAGAGAPEEVTASQMLDWASNTNGVLLTRTAGSWAALANVGTDNGDLVFTENNSPVAPASGKAKLFGSDSGGRQMMAQLAPAGAKALMQPFLGQQHFGGWWPQGGGTGTITTIGIPTATTSGTVRARTPTSTNTFSAARRLGFDTGGVAASAAGVRSTTTYLLRQSGFHVVYRFGFADAITTGRVFVGIQANTAAPTDVDPSTFANILGVGTDAGDTVLQLYAAGAAAQARTSLGANFPAATVSVDIYELALYCAPGGNVSYQVTRINTGDVASGTISAAAALPATTTFLTNQVWRTNGVTAGSAMIDLFSLYVETDV